MSGRLPLVSVVIPVYNQGRYLHEAVDSALRQEGPDLEVLVVDDGSTEDLDLARYRGDRRVQLLARPHRGISAARNAGIECARGRYVAFLDADDWWPPADKLAAQTGFLEAEPAAGWIFGDMRHHLNGPGEPRHAFLREAGFYAEESVVPRIVPLAVRDLCRDGFLVPTGCVVVRRSCLDRAGGFDETLRMYEDVDLWIRLLRAAPVAFLPRVLLARRIHAGNTGAGRFRHLDDLRALVRRHGLEQEGVSLRRESQRSRRALQREERKWRNVT